MNIDTSAKGLIKAVQRLEKQTGAYSINYFRGKLRVLVEIETFRQIADGRTTKKVERISPDYPWKAEVTVEGVTFVALLDSEEAV